MIRMLLRLAALVAAIAVVAIGVLARDGFRRWPTAQYEAPPASARGWDDVLAHPAPIDVETLITGFIDMNRCDNLDPASPLTASCSTPAPLQDLAHLVRHRLRGDFLIDTGLSARFADAPPYGDYSLAMQLFNRALGVRNGQERGRDVAAILSRRAVHPRAAFFTHLHPDHTSGAVDLPADIDYVFGAGEDGFLGRVAVGSHFAGKRLKTLNYDRASAMPPLGRSIDLLGDGSLWAIATPGHTPGHTSYLVNGERPTLIVGDASHFAWAFEHDVPPRAMTRADAARAAVSLAELRQFAARYPRVRLVFGHEIVR